MAALTLYEQENVGNARLHGASLNVPAQWYCALYVTAQDPSEGGTECADANYARETIDFNAWAGGYNKNNGAVTFASASGFAASQSIEAIGLCDSISGGHCREYVNLSPAVNFSAGQSPRITDQGLLASNV